MSCTRTCARLLPLPVLNALRERIQRLEGGAARPRTVLPFGIKAIDKHLPEGGLALGALHEVAGVYGHLFPRHDDSEELAAAERALLA